MGLKNDINKLQAQSIDNYEEYMEEVAETKRNYAELSAIYNQLVATINSERLSFRKEIRMLYDFLQSIGGDLKKDHRISVFDYVDEKPAPIPEDDSLPDSLPKEEFLDLKIFDGWDVLAEATLGFVGEGISKIRMYKKMYSVLLKAVETQKMNYDNDIYQRVYLCMSLQDAIEIAKIYRAVIITVKDTIAEKIIPELELIQAFLYADAIREKVIEDEELCNIQPCNIAEYKGRKQDIHYQFVKNTFDFYKISTAFFQNTVLTDILRDRIVTEEEKQDFNKQVAAIEQKIKVLESQKVI